MSDDQNKYDDGREGHMDLSEHQATWSLFMSLTKVTSFITVFAVAYLTMVFAMGLPAIASLVGVVVVAAIVAFLFR